MMVCVALVLPLTEAHARPKICATFHDFQTAVTFQVPLDRYLQAAGLYPGGLSAGICRVAPET